MLASAHNKECLLHTWEVHKSQVSADRGLRNGGLRKRLFSMQTELQKPMQHLFLFCENQCKQHDKLLNESTSRSFGSNPRLRHIPDANATANAKQMQLEWRTICRRETAFTWHADAMMNAIQSWREIFIGRSYNCGPSSNSILVSKCVQGGPG